MVCFRASLNIIHYPLSIIHSCSTCKHHTTFDNVWPCAKRTIVQGVIALLDRRMVYLLLFWLLALAPLTGTFLTHYPDERHYTDAALWMLETGDYLTPLAADGSQRLIKPIMPYWSVAGAYQFFGITIFTSRLLFLLAGALTIWVTFRCACELLGDRGRGLTATLITAAHVQLILAATRSMPDVLLTLFLMISSWGFTRLLLLNKRTPTTYWLAYGGAGLALASKGLLALVFIVYIFAFAFFWMRPRPRLRELIDLPALIGGVLLGSGWYLAMFALHGRTFWNAFWLDQVEEKITRTWYEPFTNIPLFALLLLINFVPWSIIALETWLRRSTTSTPEAGTSPRLLNLNALILGWAALCCIVFGLGGNPSLRYLLPVAPLLSIGLAEMIHTHPLTTARPLRGWAATLSVMLIVLGVALGLLNMQLGHWWPGVMVLLFGVLLGGALLRELKRGTWSPVTLITACIVLLCPLMFLGTHRAFLPDSVTSLTRAVQAQQPQWGDKPLVLIGHPSVAAKMRIVSGGTLRLGQSFTPPPEGLSANAVYLLAPEFVLSVDQRSFDVQRIAAGYVQMKPAAFAKAVFTWRLRDFLEAHRQYFILAQPKRSVPSPPGRGQG